MAKVRVYTLAKEAGIENKEMVDKLIGMGFDVKSHSSALDDAVADEARQQLGLIETKTERKRIQSEGKTTIIRRRTKMVVAEEPPAETPEAASSAAEPVEESPGKESAPEQAEPEVVVVEKDIEETQEPVQSEAAAVAVTEGEPPPIPPAKPADEALSEGDQIVGEPITEDKNERETPVVEEPAKVVSNKRTGLAKVIKRSAIILPEEEARPQRPKKSEKKGKAVAKPKNEEIRTPEILDDDAADKGKKGKRYVKFSPDPTARERQKKGGGGKRKGRVDVDMEDVDAFGGRLSGGLRVGRVRRGGGKKSKQHDSGSEVAETKAIKKRIKVFETITVSDFAHRMGVKGHEIIANLMGLGVMATLNQALDVETATLVANDFGYEVEQGITEEQAVINLEETYSGGEEVPRPPVVTVMGHVDHGKTSILDAIRKTDVAAGEAGGITQHIGAHYVRSNHGDVVFLDTPGHAAFTEMRSRGAKVTDVVVLVVAADDGVMDQTREAISHARAADVPIVVAVNKIDKPDANVDRVKGELAEYDLSPEEWGGQTIYCETSAKQNIGIEELLEQILLQAEILELKADPARKAKGWVVEAQLHKGRGPVATILVQHGTLRVGDSFVVGEHFGRVRSMHNDKGSIVEEAGPSMPVEVHGLSGVPRAGDEFVVVPDEKMAKTIANQRQMKLRETELASTTKISLENLFEHLQEGEMKELRVVLRADVQGTLEAFSSAIEKLGTDQVKVKVLHQGTGAIIESDILLASASDALIFGFNVRPGVKAKELAAAENVDMRFYDVIYHALDDIRGAMTGLLDPTFVEKVIGTIEVRETFNHPKAGTIAGSYVSDGRVDRNSKVRIVRDGVVVYTGKIGSLRRFKDDVKEVQSGFECGISIENYNDIKPGDVLEAFIMEEVAGEL
ncbi:MAG: translation initiation factor IF-2 [Proteobacteria bacterium]|nr:translation initiation factor IF-2 [Pseudomonadota bacterium]MBU1737627.1 translation initiation factor IF-2 [Pseudomonadota bacterium]